MGVDAETYSRIVKFQKAINFLMYGNFNKLSDIAYQLDYSDQSHFNREFKYFTGLTPNGFLKNGNQKKSKRFEKEPISPLRILKC